MAQIPSQITAGDALWELLDEQTLSVAAAAITFSGIDPTFTFFGMTIYIVKDGTASNVFLRFNNDSGANYEYQRVSANDVTDSGSRSTAQSAVQLTVVDSLQASQEFNGRVIIAKPVSGEEGQVVASEGFQGFSATAVILELTGGQWNDTSALINRIDVLVTGGNLDADTRMLLEGAEPT